MKTPLPDAVLLLSQIKYKESSDFNGVPLATLERLLKCDWPSLRAATLDLIKNGSGAILWPDVDINSHINRRGFPPKSVQKAHLMGLSTCPEHTCLYPTKAYLKNEVDREEYSGKPYTLALALGDAQLDFRTFDLHVLEIYRNDPRYRYNCSDISGLISIRDEYSNGVAISDQVLLQSFGFAYDNKFHRVVAVYLRYLAALSPEHQQIWKAREITGKFELHPDYYRASVLGEFPERISVFDAYCQELYLINAMCKAIGRPQLFRKDFGKYGEDRPPKFAFLLRPTLEDYSAFVLLLDKVLSDNISAKFFLGDVELEEEIKRDDGRVEVRRKGTIHLLDEWIRDQLKTDDDAFWNDWDEVVSGIKTIRNERQKPAHAIERNEFDYDLIPRQRELMKKGYKAVQLLRMVLENHPAVRVDKSITVPDALRSGMIWTL